MKTYLPIFVPLCLLALGACQEIEYRDVEKLVHKTDTITKYIDRYFVSVDSIEVPVEVPVQVPTRQKDSIVYVTKIDTVYVTRVDTVWRERIVYEHETDTVVITRHQIDTLWLQATRLVHYTPSEVRHIVSQFYEDAQTRGKSINTYYVNIRFKKLDAVEQARSYQVDDQWLLFISDRLTFDEAYLPLYRELSRIQFRKEYSQEPASVLYPFFDNNLIRWSNRDEYQEEIEEFFE